MTASRLVTQLRPIFLARRYPRWASLRRWSGWSFEISAASDSEISSSPSKDLLSSFHEQYQLKCLLADAASSSTQTSGLLLRPDGFLVAADVVRERQRVNSRFASAKQSTTAKLPPPAMLDTY